MPSDPDLQAQVDALFRALQARDAADVEARCAPVVAKHLTELMASAERQFTHFPAFLQLGNRAAVRGMAIDASDSPVALWLGFDGENGWLCTQHLVSRDAAQAWLREGHDGPAFTDLFAKTLDAINQRRMSALRTLTHPDWQSHPASVERLAHTLPTDATVHMAAPARLRDGRGVAELDVNGESVWLAAVRSGAEVLIAAQLDERGAMAWIRGDTQRLPVWSTLPEDTGAHTLATAIVAAMQEDAQRPDSADPTAWAILTEEPPDGLQAVVGATRALPDLHRAALEIRLVDPTDPDWTEESRWGYLERDRAGSAWRLRAASSSGSVDQLLVGKPLSWSGGSKPSTSEDPLDALKKTLGDALGSSEMPDLKAMFDGVARTFTQNVTGEAPPPDVVDLAAERARRDPDSAPAGDLGAFLRNTLSKALAGAVEQADDTGERVTLDADTLSEKGPELATSLFAALTQALVPDNIQVDLPADPLQDDLDATDRDAGQATRTVDVDLGSMVARLFESARTVTPPPTVDDDEDAP